MKLTNQQLKQIIREELQNVLEIRGIPSTVNPNWKEDLSPATIIDRLKVRGMNLENEFLKQLAQSEDLEAWMTDTCALRGSEKGGSRNVMGNKNQSATYAIESVMRALVDIGGQQAGALLLKFPGCSGAGLGMR